MKFKRGTFSKQYRRYARSHGQHGRMSNSGGLCHIAKCASHHLYSILSWATWPLRRAQIRLAVVITGFLLFLVFILLHDNPQSMFAVELDPSMWQIRGWLHNGSDVYPENSSSTNSEEDSYLPVYSPHCPSLINGDPQEISLVKEMLFKEVYKAIGPDVYVAATGNCTSFRKPYWSRLPSSVESDFPIAYTITVHKGIEQVEHLLRAIYRPWNFYCIHVDHKAPFIFHQAVRGIASCFTNVFIATQLEWVVYGGYSRLKADINCMRDLLQDSRRWNYVINLAGQEFPLKTNYEIVQRLTVLNGKNDISSVVPDKEHIKDRYRYIHQRILSNDAEQVEQTLNLKSSPPGNVTIRFGTAYNVFSRHFVDYVLYDKFAQELLNWFEDTYSPDEHFWATLQVLPSTPGGLPEGGWSSFVRAVKWSYFEDIQYPACTGRYIRDICVYGVGDLQWLTQQQHFFANKFDLSADHVVYYCLDDYIANKTLQ